MSTSRSRLTRSIQEIAKRDPDLRRAIEATKPRGDQAAAAGVGASDAERDRICCDGSVSDDANPGTEVRDTSEGGQDGLNPDDTADIGDMGPGSLTGLTDCATGEPVCFDGSGFVPPDGWSEPNDPPVDPTYEQGLFWGNGDSFSVDCRTISPTKSRTEELVDIYDSPSYLEVMQFTCSGSRGSNCEQREPACNPDQEDILLNGGKWPSDSCVNLIVKSGSIVGSKYDPENDGSYSKPMSEIELCDGFGNSFYLRPSANGGWKSISDLTTGPDGHLYDSTGMQIRRISHDEFTDSTV